MEKQIMNFLLLHRAAGCHAGRLGLCSGLLLIFFVMQAAALVPEPYTLYYGQAKSLEGTLLTRESGAEVIVRIDGRVNTRYLIGDLLAGDVNYIVRVKVDDGLYYLYDPAAAREGDIPEIVIRDEETEYGVDQIIPPVGERGTVYNVDIEAVPEPCLGVFVWVGMLFLGRAYKTDQT
jgi:hypothetical protein